MTQTLESMTPITLDDLHLVLTDDQVLTALAKRIHYSPDDEASDINDGFTYREAIDRDGIYLVDVYTDHDQIQWSIDYGDTNSGGLNLTQVDPYADVTTIKHQLVAELTPLYQHLKTHTLTLSVTDQQLIALYELVTGVLDQSNPYDVSATYIKDVYHSTPEELKTALDSIFDTDQLARLLPKSITK